MFALIPDGASAVDNDVPNCATAAKELLSIVNGDHSSSGGTT